MLTAFLLATATLVPPGEWVVDHSHTGHFAQPTLRRFERYEEDNDRRIAYDAYCNELDQLWAQYRKDGSTPAAFKAYEKAAAEAKRRYVYNDPFLAPVTR
jgi:hypothetical protein